MIQEVEILTRITSIKELLFNEIKKVFEDKGLSSTELMIIYKLQHKQAQYKMSDLATALFLPMSTMTGVIDKMFEKGIVQREHSAEDRRVIIIQLNPEFRKESEHYMGDLIRVMDEITNCFSAQWLANFRDSLQAFQESLEKRNRE